MKCFRKESVPPAVRSGQARVRPASFAQQRVWFFEQVEGELAAYNLPQACRLKGPLDIGALRRALETIIARHEPLRSVFQVRDGEPIQVVRPPPQFELPEHDLRDLAGEAQELEVARLMSEEAEQPFDPERELMLRAKLLRVTDSERLLLLTQHGIASDDRSRQILWKELRTLYDAFTRDDPSPLPELTVNYADYADWQRKQLREENRDRLLAYWRKRLEGMAPLELPTDRPRPPRKTYKAARHEFRLGCQLTTGLEKLSVENGATLETTLLAAFQILLSRYGGRDDIAVGVSTPGRLNAKWDSLIGLFGNTLVMREDLSGDPTFPRLLQRVRDTSREADAHQELPFEMLVEELHPERHPGRSPLVQVLFQSDDSSGGSPSLTGVETEILPCRLERTEFDLEMYLWPVRETVRGALVYSTDLFDASTIERMAGHFVTLLEGIVTDPGGPISALPLLTETERNQLLVEWNDTAADHPRDKCVHHLIEEQVARTPENVAVIFEGNALTYRELNGRANALAGRLRELGVGPDTPVVLCCDRSLSQMVALLGILKAGGAYVPITPSEPAARIQDILPQVAPPVILTESAHAGLFARQGTPLVLLDGFNFEESPGAPASAPPRCGTPGDLAYLIFTSGSTGRPKGVAVNHDSVVNHIFGAIDGYGFQARDRVLQFASLSFDAAVEEIFPAWARGATLVLRSDATPLEPMQFTRWCAQEKISVLDLPTAFWQLWISALRSHGQELPPSLETVVIGGEKVLMPALEAWTEVVGERPVRLFNSYGPTEATVIATIWELPPGLDKGSLPDPPPIGRPVANTRVHVLDEGRRLVPVGVPGELYIAGRCLARGYWNRPGLTAERFVSDPFDDSSGARMYRTGDRVRWLSDGTLEFQERLDFQVKLRGYRIELGEIESTLASHDAVSQSVVVVDDGVHGEKRLVAYTVPPRPGQTELSSPELRAFVRARLPDYMVPSVFVPLEEIPLTPSGKVDRDALPPPEMSRAQGEARPTAPRNELEWQIKAICENVLGVWPISVTDNFFDLGGHSLLVMRLLAGIEKMLHEIVPLAEFFRDPTVEGLAAFIRRGTPHEQRAPGIFPLQPDNRNRQVFWVPSVGGVERSVECLRLSELLGESLGFHGFDAATGCPDIRSLAEHCVRNIRTVQPSGPYALAGYCQCGHVAHEIAIQLQALGEEVDLLAILGCSARDFPRLTLRQNLCWVRDGFRRHRSGVYKRVVAMIGRRIGRRIGRVISGATIDAAPALEERFLLHEEVVARHRPGYFEGRIMLFNSEDDFLSRINPELGWDALARGVEVHRIRGDHSEMLKDPFVHEVAAILRARACGELSGSGRAPA